MFDVRKTLKVLNEEWENCEKCSLGTLRKSFKGSFVAGEGVRRGVMFVGEGPGEVEQDLGVPFANPKAGKLLRDVLDKLQFRDYYYTNLVSCRSCEVMVGDDGQPLMRKQYKGPPVPKIRDRFPPLPVEIASCLPRLHEEIYLVDPIVIVTLGVASGEALLNRSVAITRDRGRATHCEIPGATLRPVLTEKKKAWGRKVKGEYVLPTEQNTVKYLLIPTYSPAYVINKVGDRGNGSAIQQFAEDIRMAIKIYERHLLEAFGQEPTSTSDATIDLQQDSYGAEDYQHG